MTPSIITLIAWSPFLLLALIFGICFTLRGAKKGAARAGIAFGATVLSAIASVFTAKLISVPVGKSLMPLVDGFTSGTSSLGADALERVEAIVTGIAGALASLVLFVPVLIIISIIFKVVASVITTKLMRDPKHVANKIGGGVIGFVDAMVLAILILLPLYGTLSLAKEFKPIIAELPETEEVMEYVDAATAPFVIDIAGIPPFETTYDYLMSFKVEGSTVSVSKTARQAGEIYLEIAAIGDIKNMSNKDAIEVLESLERVIVENEFITDFACAFL